MPKTTRQTFRAMLKPGAALILPGVANALAARVVADCGFGATYVTGAGIANSFLGIPDNGLVTLTELTDHVVAIRAVFAGPLMVDADTGFGNALNMRRTIQVLERAGADAIQIEDQVLPKRCGHFEGKQLVSRAEMVQKVKAAVDARQGGLLILARTDARAVEGLAAALDRAAAYLEAGADLIFVEAPQSAEELAAIPRELRATHLCNMVYGGRTPLLPRESLAGMGYAGIIYANAALQASMLAMQRVLSHLRKQGSLEGAEELLVSFDDRQKLVDYAAYQELERRYTGA